MLTNSIMLLNVVCLCSIGLVFDGLRYKNAKDIKCILLFFYFFKGTIIVFLEKVKQMRTMLRYFLPFII